MREESIDATRTSHSSKRTNGTWHRRPEQKATPPLDGRNRVLRPDGDDRTVIRLQPQPEPSPPGLLDRLLERKVAQWFIAYVAIAWILLQLTEILADMWNLPLSFQRGISMTLGLGTFPALVVAWYHGEMGRQQVCWAEVGIIAAMLLGTGAMVWQVCFL